MFLFFVAGVMLANIFQLFGDGQTRAIGVPAPRHHRPQTHIENSGFELGQAGWKDIAADMLGARIYSDSTIAFEGQHSLKIDLEKARRFPGGKFLLASPWLALAGGGNFSFSIYVKSNRPQTKVSLRVFNAVTTQGMRSGKQQQMPVVKEFQCNENWQQLVFAGRLPVAEKDNYRFVVQLTDPAIYWLDKVELLHNGQRRISAPEIEAALQPISTSTKLYPAPGHAPALLRVVNHTDRAHRFQFIAQQHAHLNRFEHSIEKQIVLEPHQTLLQRLQFEVPHADVYDINWQLLDQNFKPVQLGEMRLAAINLMLPHAKGGEPVWGMHLNDVNLETTLPILHSAGIRYLRNVANLHWDLLEQVRGKWEWPDSLVQYLKSQGFFILGKLGYTPKWAIDPARRQGWPLQNKMPVSLGWYRNYIRSVVSHYRQEIDCWEIWNEPNLPRFFDGTPEDYATLLSAAVTEIKTLQPEAQVAGYALAQFYNASTFDFVQTVINNQPALRVEVVSFHPYSHVSPEEAGLAERINQLRALFKERQGYEPQLWITELGFAGKDTVNEATAYYSPAQPRTVDELTQAAYLVRAACLSKMAAVKYFFCYAMDSERIARGPDIHGLLDEGWSANPKPALLAYLTLASLLGDARFEQRIDLGNEEVYLLQYRRQDEKNITVLWTTKAEKSINVPRSLLHADRYDLFGNRLNSSAAALVAGPLPIYFLY